ncbi:MAG: exodeoxyribonuclease VII large subunit [Puniceicoccales bacterium]|jgi:exodeoxyribonuclease VII large subunit|nr:exodeoxyribonuclease VII large subunit [Puniceicoccales bacterium]
MRNTDFLRELFATGGGGNGGLRPPAAAARPTAMPVPVRRGGALGPAIGTPAARAGSASGSLTGGAEPLTVSEFTRRVKFLLEGGFPSVAVRGEISNLRRQPSGHVYFTLKDAGSQLAAVLFRGDAQRVGFPLADGAQVIAFGAAGVYEPRGSYQIIVRQLEPDGVGRLRMDYERLRRKLEAEGLFDPAAKRPLPVPPRAVGVVTSPAGAALRDFLRILNRRGWRGRVVIIPTRVQGAGAGDEIAAAVRRAGALGFLDLLVVTRGGGSIEDLWAFNEEAVARAVRASPVPVISAVGHETDTTLCDFAADRRAETPSGAAELISSLRLECAERAGRAAAALNRAAEFRAASLGRALALLLARLAPTSPRRRVETAWMRLDDLRNRLRTAPAARAEHDRRSLAECRARLRAFDPRQRVKASRQRANDWAARLNTAARHRCVRLAERIDALLARLRAAGTDSILRRGFALVFDAAGGVVRSAEAIRAGDTLRLRFADGERSVRAEHYS